MQEGKQRFLRKLRQIEEHARALTGELPAGDAQNRARLLWGLAAHLVTTLELDPAATPPAGIGDGATPLRPRPR